MVDRRILALHEIDATLAMLGYGRPIRIALKDTDEQHASMARRIGITDARSDDMVRALVGVWGRRRAAAIRAAREVVGAAGSVEEVVESFRRQFAGIERDPGVEPVVASSIGIVYDLDRREVAGQVRSGVSFDLADQQARDWLAHDTMFWIGSHFDRNLGGRIAEVVRTEVIEAGLGKVEAGQRLAEVVEPLIGEARSRSYWEMVAMTATTRARAFGAVRSLEEAGVEEWEVLNPLDAATCPVCRELNGRVFRTADAVAQRDATMGAESPEAVREIAPWRPARELHGRTTSQLADMNVRVPPYHGNCRCVCNIHVESATVTATPGPDVPPETRDAFAALSPGELGNKLRPIHANPDALTAHLDADLTADDIAAARGAVRDADRMVGFWDAAGEDRRFVFVTPTVRAEVDEAGLIRAITRIQPGRTVPESARDLDAGMQLQMKVPARRPAPRRRPVRPAPVPIPVIPQPVLAAVPAPAPVGVWSVPAPPPLPPAPIVSVVPPPVPATPTAQADEAMAVMRTGTTIAIRPLGGGMNASWRVMVVDAEGRRQETVWKPKNGEDRGLRRTIQTGTFYRREAAVYEIDRALGGTPVTPPTVVRRDPGTNELGSAQEFILDAHKATAPAIDAAFRQAHGSGALDTSERSRRMLLLDILTANTDRHDTNVMWRQVGGAIEPVAIDNGLALPTGSGERWITSMFLDPHAIVGSFGAQDAAGLADVDRPVLARKLAEMGIERPAVRGFLVRLDALQADPTRVRRAADGLLAQRGLWTPDEATTSAVRAFVRDSHDAPESLIEEEGVRAVDAVMEAAFRHLTVREP